MITALQGKRASCNRTSSRLKGVIWKACDSGGSRKAAGLKVQQRRGPDGPTIPGGVLCLDAFAYRARTYTAGSPRSWSYDYSPNGSLPETSATSHTIRTVIAAAKRYSLAVMDSAVGARDSGRAGNEGSGRAGDYVTPSTSLRTQIENGATTDFCPSILFGSEPNDCDLVGRGWHSL
jgi:hypothetical protein